MSTTKLLWNCVWRATAHSAGLGVVLGTIYGAFTAPAAGAVRGLVLAEGTERLQVALLNFLGSVPLGSAVGVLAGGLVFGPLIGLVLGPLNGFFLFALIRAFSLGREKGLLTNRRILAWVACLATAVVAVAVALWHVLSNDPQFFSRLEPREAPGARGARPQELIDLTILTVGPALMSVVALRLAGSKVFDRYAREVSGAERGEQAPADSERPETS